MSNTRYSCSVNLRTFSVRESAGPQIKIAKDIAKSFADIENLPQEAFFVISLNQKHWVIDKHMVSLGTLTGALVHPREVFRPVIIDGGAALAIVHNHPSGDPAPSAEDRQITKRLSDAAELLGIRFLDHVIIGKGRFFSFVDECLM